MQRLIITITFLSLLFYAVAVPASGIIIGSGATINLNGQTISLNCTDLVVKNGGSLNLGQGLIDSCRHFTLEAGSALIDGSGEITLCGTWENNSLFQINPASTFSFVPGCDVRHYVRGSGDTDGDGVSDMHEGFHDANDDGMPDFLDSLLSAIFWTPNTAVHMLLLLDDE